MQTGISKKVALVTASTQGIGFATAQLLAEEGATVWVHGRGGDNLHHALERIRKAVPGARVNGVAADLAADGGVAHLLEQVPAVDILVNGYADTGARMLADLSAADWDAILHNNLATTSAISTHYLAGMLQKAWGRVVFVSSDLALRPLPYMVPYSAAKMAQLTLARGLAEMTADTEVTVNAVMPGFTQTERTESILRSTADRHGIPFEKFMHDYFRDPACSYVAEVGHATSLIKRLLRPEEVANLIVYLCSQLSSGTNGTTLRCDGGATLTAL
jgi:NAD(P)-dependent dehydrogenase (short-subunit alcohol dehydrogenase family)